MKNHIIFCILLAQFLLTSCQPQGGGSEANVDSDSPEKISFLISWTPPTERKNQERLYPYEIGGYEIIYRKVGEPNWNSIVIYDDQSWVLDEYKLVELSPGTYEIAMATFDIDGLFSDYSQVVTISK